MRFEVRDDKTVALKTIFHSLTLFSDHITVYTSKTGLHLQGMDSCHICLFDCKLDAEWFNSYVHDGATDHFTVVSKVLSSVTKMIMPDQTGTFTHDTCDTLEVSVSGGNVSCDKDFTIPLMTIEHETVDLAPLLGMEPEAEICMTSKHLSELVAQFGMFDEVLEFKLSEENAELSAKGEAGCMTARLDLEGGHLLEYAIVEDLEFTQAFCLRYVKLMTGFGPVATEVKLSLFYEEKPMFMTYELGMNSTITLMLAPRA